MFNKILRASVVSALMLLLVSGAAFAASDGDSHLLTISISPITLLDMAQINAKNLEYTLTAGDAGEKPTLELTSGDTNKYLNYTSITSSKARKITVKLNANLPSWLKLNLESSDPMSGGGVGARGKRVVGGRDLSGTAQDIVTDIGSCWTGKGVGSGPSLTYTLSIVDAEVINIASTDSINETVTITLTD